jgi:predicted  nucleic acid-binding Zn-ribbon protein
MDPLVLLNLMVELAGLEEELVDASAVLAHNSRREIHLRDLHQEYVDDAAAAEAEGRNAAVTLRQTEVLIRQIEATLERKKDQIGKVQDKRQYQAVQDEIKSLEAELERLETAGLELLDSSDRKDGDVEQAQVDLNLQSGRGDEEMTQMATESSKANAAEEEIVQEIDRLIGMMPQAEGRHVARLRGQYDQAVVRVENGACGGCFGQFPVQVGIDAAQGRALVRCSSCARFVVRKSWK